MGHMGERNDPEPCHSIRRPKVSRYRVPKSRVVWGIMRIASASRRPGLSAPIRTLSHDGQHEPQTRVLAYGLSCARATVPWTTEPRMRF